MRVVLLNQPFYPDVVATAQMGKDLADELVARGHSVTAVCSRSIYGKSGAQLPRREVIDGIEIRRVGASVFGRRGTVARLADFLLFYVRAGWAVLTGPRADVVVAYTTPPFIAMLAVLAKWLRGSRAVYWVMDLYPDVPVASGMLKREGFVSRVLERVHRFILKRCDKNVVLGRCMAERLREKGVAEEKIELIRVWPVEGGIRPEARETNEVRREWGIGDDFVVMYSGNFGIAHDVETVLGAMREMRGDEGVRFEFVGGGKRRGEVEAFISKEGVRNAAYRDYVPVERLSSSLSAGDVHLITMLDGMEGLIVPSKLFGAMSAGRPSVFVGPRSSEIGRVLEESGGGVVVEPGDVAGLVSVLRRLKEDAGYRLGMGEAARRAVEERYDKGPCCSRWVEVLEGVVGVGGRGGGGGDGGGDLGGSCGESGGCGCEGKNAA